MSAATAPAAEAFAPEGGDRARREFLTCTLGDETYGIDILRVQEIREVAQVTRVPHVSRFVRGVINLRGAIVPIVDLGLMFGFAEPLPLAGASAIVLNMEQRLVGLVVSSVSDVLALAEDEIHPPPELGERAVAAALSGIVERRHAQAGEGEGDGDGEARATGSGSVLLLDVPHLMRRVREDRA